MLQYFPGGVLTSSGGVVAHDVGVRTPSITPAKSATSTQQSLCECRDHPLILLPTFGYVYVLRERTRRRISKSLLLK